MSRKLLIIFSLLVVAALLLVTMVEAHAAELSSSFDTWIPVPYCDNGHTGWAIFPPWATDEQIAAELPGTRGECPSEVVDCPDVPGSQVLAGPSIKAVLPDPDPEPVQRIFLVDHWYGGWDPESAQKSSGDHRHWYMLGVQGFTPMSASLQMTCSGKTVIIPLNAYAQVGNNYLWNVDFYQSPFPESCQGGKLVVTGIAGGEKVKKTITLGVVQIHH